jgi:phosphocarrier protein HPr
VARPDTSTGERVLEKLVRETTVEIKNADGLHMRPAMQFVDTANRFHCDIVVSNGETDADGKSIMQMTMLAVMCGTRLYLRAEGPDADQALDALRELVEVRMFGEPPPRQG